MGDTNFRGPVNAMGSLEAEYTSAYTTAQIAPFDGPSIFYQNVAMPDPRMFPFQAEGMLPGRVAAVFNNLSPWAAYNIPQAAATNVIATAQVATVSAAMTLVQTQAAGAVAGTPSIAVDIPILPQGASTVTTAPIAIDFGFITGTTVANSTTLAVSDNTKLSVGQWILIGGCGASNQGSQFTQVMSISTTNYTGVTVSPAPTAALGNAPIGQSNLFGAGLLPPGTQFGPSTPLPTYHDPRLLAGLARLHNPAEALARNVSISQATAGVATAATFLVSGWDFWRQPMTELITMTATTNGFTIHGKKAFKYVASVLPNTNITAGNSYAVGIGDTFGFAFRADNFAQVNCYVWAGTTAGNATGFTAAATTRPATNTTGDVRGTLQVSSNGAGSAITGTLASNNTSLLAMLQDPLPWNIIAATPNDFSSLYGVANSTT